MLDADGPVKRRLRDVAEIERAGFAVRLTSRYRATRNQRAARVAFIRTTWRCLRLPALLSVAAFQNLNLLRERGRRVLQADRKLLRDFLARQSAVSAVWTDWGTTSFVKLRDGNGDIFLERLRAEFDTSAVPGRFFQMPDHFRIGIGGDTEMTATGLERLAQALDDYHRQLGK